jgi:4-hydroxy-tetrahydrodipicolinate reductase
MGATVCAAVLSDPELQLVAAVDPAHVGERILVSESGQAGGNGGPRDLIITGGPDAMTEAGAEVAVDFTVAASALVNAEWCARTGVHAVIGTTGFTSPQLAGIRERFETGTANCVLAPNFAIGAVLMMRFAELAAPWFETVEIIELHHDAKLDAPSGTASLTAQRIAGARKGAPARADGTLPARGTEGAPGVQVHSVRLRGLVAHHEVLFGTTGQLLTLRHDSIDRSSFMPGVLLAIKQVPARRGFTLGLDALLGT